MFGWLSDPFFGFGSSRYDSPFFRDPFDRFEDRLRGMFRSIIEDEYQMMLPRPARDEPEEEEKESKGEEKEQKEQKHEPKTQYYESSSFSSSVRNGRDAICEHRTKCYDSRTGKTLETTERHIGDKYFKCEETIDADNQKSSKETWHNVAEEEMQKFKDEWEKRRGEFGFSHLGSLFGPKQTAIKHDEEKKEEKKEEKGKKNKK